MSEKELTDAQSLIKLQNRHHSFFYATLNMQLFNVFQQLFKELIINGPIKFNGSKIIFPVFDCLISR